MQITLNPDHMRAIEAHLEAAYPNEGAGFVLGRVDGERVMIKELLPLANRREAEAQHNRYELGPHDFMQAEDAAEARGLDLVGVFHSHPDHPNRPSEFDRAHALPNFSYLITTVAQGKAGATRAWRLLDDRSQFTEDVIVNDED
jgi:proteasome lid subunit RPN8/RPN11